MNLIASDLGVLKGLRRGDRITVRDADVVDWTIVHEDGSEEGNFIGKFLDTHQP